MNVFHLIVVALGLVGSVVAVRVPQVAGTPETCAPATSLRANPPHRDTGLPSTADLWHPAVGHHFDVRRSMFDVRCSSAAAADDVCGPIDSRALVPVVAAARFETVDVYIDAGDAPLAAYQFTIHSATKSALLSGLEGGEHPAFSHPPYYDNAALIDEKVIVAAFSTADALPQGRTRVARLHVNVQDEKDAEYVATLQTAAGADGSVIPAKVSVVVTKR